ncbi:alanine--tRNA ligase [Aeromicrobium tamlense]|uniref:Alanine--tRNA ligase n=1 Tax=Aeromicrobium tamlense TaxID=375541 RepID=A0A8I0FZL3_9ACTN|nr:alanine--tRNA ligase [Aeromicrobium tamlense]MBD1270395.1 alanine--tRNA ligase [Aeromicrobium tamlense]MBD1271473.1 alanine--tRNA ligase [Aeromicrobium tamlense]NYI37782.1 alanyl-tRNA synthetase [Aeromicrobium tamlense]
METAEIRRRFLNHFENAGHTVVPSAPLLFDDPNLLFVNAGMVPFKPYFLGQETPPFDRATSVQKCVRTLDIEEVGKTTRHGTFFQMNGNFSFGDYFKEGAITLAWELITKSVDDGGLGFDPEKIWVTVLHTDTEAREIWKRVAGLPDERIQNRGLLDNYWHMGVEGPGGPCSEIYVDRGPEYGPDGGPEADEDRFLEIWNLVFMQEEITNVTAKDQFDVLQPLPKQNIDTGMGLERVAYLLQGKENLYEIDEVFPVIERASELTGRTYGADHTDDVRFRVVADHVRSSLMLIGDGVTPGNESRGYVLRRLLRRAVRSMRLLGYEDPALPQLLPVSMERMKASYPELETDFARISQIAYAEEEAFRQTLGKGTQIFDVAAGETKRSGGTVLGGQQAFQLHDTYGFPIDLTLEMAEEQGLSVDQEGFRSLMAEQKARAKADAKSKKGLHADTTVYRETIDAFGPTDWVAYTNLITESKVLALLSGGQSVPVLSEGQVGEVVLDRTGFYAESGGQNADAGVLRWDGGRAEVLDVQRPIRGLVVHQVRVVEGELTTGFELSAEVDHEWRVGARQAHSGTHVVHAALREVLGPTALQSGSYNRPGYLRLDFGWGSALDPEQFHQVEQVSNRALREDLQVSQHWMTLPEAKEFGALALFGETYGEEVRVIEIGGPWSRELCGGTHVERSSQIGTVVLTSDTSVGAGNRRIEALTGIEGFQYLARERDLVLQLTDVLKAKPEDLPHRVQDLVSRLKGTEKELEKIRTAQLQGAAGDVAKAAEDIDGVAFVGHRAEGVGGGDVRQLALDIRGRITDRPAVVVVIGTAGDKPSAVVALNPAAIDRGLSAQQLIATVGERIGGRGGGKADVAQGGGTDLAGIDPAFAAVRDALRG